jgi:hypothetical protein
MMEARRAAPHPEWVQMYRQGIPAPKIAAAAGVAKSTVRYHLHIAALEAGRARLRKYVTTENVTQKSPSTRYAVEKKTLPVERVRLDKETVTDDVTVEEEVRKENIETDTDTGETRR